MQITPLPTVRVTAATHHRNGICGAPFHALLFDHDGGRKLAILFDEPGHCAVIDVDKLAAGDIAFGSNSWRGDFFEKPLRHHLQTHSQRKELYE